jgi:hypothetical protein
MIFKYINLGINLTNLEETMYFFLQSLEEMRKALGLE